MEFIYIALFALTLLGVVVGVFTIVQRRRNGNDDTIVQASGDCATCSGIDKTCEQTCMMVAATQPIIYFDDEELDRFQGRNSDDYTATEIEEFAEVLYTMRPEEAKEWNRSLILRGINVPNEMKDELIAMIEG